jgi:hypothetical protein
MICACADSVSPKIIQGHHIVGKPPTTWTSGTNGTMGIRTSLIVGIVAQGLLDGRGDVAITTAIEKVTDHLATIEAGAVVEVEAGALAAAARRITGHLRAELSS